MTSSPAWPSCSNRGSHSLGKGTQIWSGDAQQDETPAECLVRSEQKVLFSEDLGWRWEELINILGRSMVLE